MQGRGLAEVFHVRKLIWDEIRQYANPSELEELQHAIGTHPISQNKELREELLALVEILTEYQQANDDLRDTLIKRQRLPEPPGRMLLMNKLQLMLQSCNNNEFLDKVPLSSSKDKDLLAYILKSSQEQHNHSPSQMIDTGGSFVPVTPRIKDLAQHNEGIELGAMAVLVRPATATAKRPHTASSSSTTENNNNNSTPRPFSRGSTLSVASAPAVLEQIEIQRHLNVDQIDSIRPILSEAIEEEHQQLLDDIEFIQGCLEMEKDLIDEDQRQARAKQNTPTLAELNEFCRNLEKTLQVHEETKQVRQLLDRVGHPVSLATATATATVNTNGSNKPLKLARLVDKATDLSMAPAATASDRSENVVKEPRVTHKIRQTIQEARDLPFLT